MTSSNPTKSELGDFCSLVRSEGIRLYRDLPWRNTTDPYAIWISEAMLQQTQVSRVDGRWQHFMRRFPTLDSLAASAVSDVVEEWQGLGYNRRAVALHNAASICSELYAGRLPDTIEQLTKLPGIGKSTAGGILAFAYDLPVPYIETNVRAVYIHHFFPDADSVSDKEILPLVVETCPHEDVRGWYYALLDYGVYLKSRYGNPTRRSKTYSKQSSFEGSDRQKRSWLLRTVLASETIGLASLTRLLGDAEEEAGRPRPEAELVDRLLNDMAREGFFSYEKGECRI